MNENGDYGNCIDYIEENASFKIVRNIQLCTVAVDNTVGRLFRGLLSVLEFVICFGC